MSETRWRGNYWVGIHQELLGKNTTTQSFIHCRAAFHLVKTYRALRLPVSPSVRRLFRTRGSRPWTGRPRRRMGRTPRPWWRHSSWSQTEGPAAGTSSLVKDKRTHSFLQRCCDILVCTGINLNPRYKSGVVKTKREIQQETYRVLYRPSNYMLQYSWSCQFYSLPEPLDNVKSSLKSFKRELLIRIARV